MRKRRFPIIGYREDGRPVFAQAGGDGSDEKSNEDGSEGNDSEEEDKGGSSEEGGEKENPPAQGVSREEVQSLISEAVDAARDDERQKAERERQRDKEREGLSDADKIQAERDDARAELEELRVSLDTERRRGALKDAALAANVSADGVEFVLDALGSRGGKPETLVKALVDKFPALAGQTARTGGDFTGGDEQPQLTKEEFDEMGYSARVELLDKHPEVYKRFDPIP